MSSSQASQTLFRFVSVRNPQLTDESGKDKRFIFRPAVVKNQAATINVFDAAVVQTGTSTKIQLLAAAAPAFKLSAAYLNKEQAVETLVGATMYAFSIWLARNRDSFTNTELLAKVQAAGAVLSLPMSTSLWNNLFYQVVTQESFYVKEAIIQVLTANHVIQNLDTDVQTRGIENNRAHVKSTLVLPKELFLEDTAATTGIGSNAATSVPAVPKKNALSTRLCNKQVAFNASHYNEVYNQLKGKIRQIEKLFQKEYQAAYTVAYQAYEEMIKPILDNYKAELEAERVKWLNTKNKKNESNTTITVEAEPAATTVNPYDHPAILPEPNLPKFTFGYQNVIDYLNVRLTQGEIKQLNNLHINIDTINNNIGDISLPALPINLPIAGVVKASMNADNIETIFENIEAAISKNNNAIIANTTTEVNGVLAIGGVSIPLSSNASRAATCENFAVNTLALSDTSWFLNLMFESYDINIASAAYEVFDLTGNLVQTDTSLYRLSGSSYFIFIGQNPFQITPAVTNGFKLKGSFTLADGDVYNFDITTAPDYYSGIDPITGLYNLTGNGAMCKQTIPPPTGGGAGTNIVFKPSGFGVKQLGIADYKKVEQTVHCYVEGEVAHIENIMAREYREKSTRRLRRSENTTTTSKESEREHLNDTTSTDRFEMQNEVAKVMQDSKDFSANASVMGTAFGITASAGANYATHNSKEESTRAAVTQAKDITERAMDRVVSRVKQERIEKIVEEFEENNKHGFDNTKGDKHVVGVYRWVDKIYKNQIYNYGKRLMFEFMIPEPAKLHYLGMMASDNIANSNKIIKPTDPRKSSDVLMKMKNKDELTDTKAAYWAGVFNVDLDNKLDETIKISFSLSDTRQGVDKEGHGVGIWGGGYHNNDFKIPDEYEAVHVHGTMNVQRGNSIPAVQIYPYHHAYICGILVSSGYNISSTIVDLPLNNIRKNLSISSLTWDTKVISCSLTATCNLTNETKQVWQQKAFKAIIDAYQKAKDRYEDEMAQQAAKAGNIIGTNPGFYREIENMILRKNCISYLIDQTTGAKLTYGKQMFKELGKDVFKDYEVEVTKDLDNYTAFAKFLEQAFEWNIMSYYFYPFYWGAKDDWGKLYQYDNNDPIFRSFMQSGLARVVVTVRPGFEDAVRFYMQTGLVWNGGEVPVIDDPLHLSIVDELKEPAGKPEGKAWATRIPTSLTILQADSIGLKVEKALPCNCDDVTIDTWENPSAVPCGDNFVVTHDILNSGNSDKNLVQFSFVELDRIQYANIGRYDEQKLFPCEFVCMGQIIKVERDAAWQGTDSSKVIFEKLAEQLSLIAGVNAKQITSVDGNTSSMKFTIDTNTISTFTFKKPGGNDNYDLLKILLTQGSVRVVNPAYYLPKILDKDGASLEPSDANIILPISRFKI
jgi:hypothetical protein